MRKHILIFFAIIFFADLNGQPNVETLSGQVSFVSPNSVYVKFKSTAGISAGDTLFAKSNGNVIPVLIINNLSSLSCVCTVIPPAKPAVADFVTAKVKTGGAAGAAGAEKALPVAVATQIPVQETKEVSNTGKPTYGELKQRISGSVSVNSYSDLSNTPSDNSQRFRYTLITGCQEYCQFKIFF